MRFLHLIVVVALVTAAAYVYKIKFDATQQVERVAKLRGEIKRERDAVAALRAQWAQLDNPDRIQGLSQRHLPLKPIAPTQFEQIERLPERPVGSIILQDVNDPIAALLEDPAIDFPTGSVSPPAGPR
jgi:hypothetical protein